VTIEQSNGKARPTLPRAGALRVSETVRDPSEGRDADGRATAGNRLAVGAGQKHATKKLLGSGATEGDAALVARDGLRLFYGALRELPSDGAVVRTLAGLYGRHAACSAYFSAKADEAGLGTPDGVAWADAALRHGQRAERLSVTMLDVATALAAAAASRPRLDASGKPALPPWFVEVPDDAPEPGKEPR
jgi:hypothetical protein